MIRSDVDTCGDSGDTGRDDGQVPVAEGRSANDRVGAEWGQSGDKVRTETHSHTIKDSAAALQTSVPFRRPAAALHLAPGWFDAQPSGLPGVELRRLPWADLYEGRTDDLLAAGLVAPHELPGYGDNAKTCTWWLPCGTRVRPNSNGARDAQSLAGGRRVDRRGRHRLSVYVAIGPEAEEARYEQQRAQSQAAEAREQARVATERAKLMREWEMAALPHDAESALAYFVGYVRASTRGLRKGLVEVRGGWRVTPPTVARVELLLRLVDAEMERAGVLFDAQARAADLADIERIVRDKYGAAADPTPKPVLRVIVGGKGRGDA